MLMSWKKIDNRGFDSLIPLLLFITTLLYSTVSPVAAQESPSEVIEEIQVTATRRAVARSDVSATLTVITSDEIARAKLTTDSLAAQPGVFLQQTTPGQGAVIIRGLKGSEVLHLVDGMRLNNAIFRNAPTQYLALVAPGTLDRIEIVRGAPASLYGSDAVGGVVQVLSRVPHFDSSGSRKDLFLGFDTADLTKIVRASAEFGNERIAALASGEYLDSGSRRTGSGGRIAPSGYESKGGRIAIATNSEPDRSWLFDLQFARQPMTPRVDELIPGFGQTEPSSSEFFFSPNDRLFAHIRHTRDDGLWGAYWVFDLGWQRIVDDRISRNYLSDTRRRENNSSDLYGLTVSASGEIESGSWIAGVEFYHDSVESRRFEENILSGMTQTVAPRFPNGSTVDHAALFGNILRKAGDKNTFSGGLRFSSVNTDLPQVGSVPASSLDQSDISADVGWVFDLADRIQLAANLGYGFRAPNVFDLGTLGDRPGNRFNIPNPDLESERITQFDVGIRHRTERTRVGFVLFALSYSDRITSVFTDETTTDGRDVTQSQNVARAEIFGAELSARYELHDSLSADFVLNYLRGEQSGTAGVDEAGDRIPPLNGRLSISYQLDDSLRFETYLRFADSQNRLSGRDIRDIRINPNGTPGWLTANLRGQWQFDGAWQLSISLENLFDKRYRVHGSGIDAVGRNLFVGFRAAW